MRSRRTAHAGPAADARTEAPRRARREIVAPLAFALSVVALWEVYCALSGVSAAALPAPSHVAVSIWSQRALLLSASAVTIAEIAIGYAAAVAGGVAVGTLVASSRTLDRAVSPWLVISQMIPVPAIAPLIVIWTGFDLRPKVIVIALVSFFPIAVNTIAGLRATDPELIGLLRTLGAGRYRRFRVARMPAALPFVFTGMKVAAALAVIGAVFAEWVGSSNGLGYLIFTFNNQTATADMFAAIAVLAVIGVALFALVGVLERLVLPWYHGAARERAG